MRRSIAVLALFLAACQAVPVTGARRTGATPAALASDGTLPTALASNPVGASPATSTRPASGTAAPSAVPSSPAAPALLLRPSGGTSTLTGVALVDPAYIVGQGAGNIIAQGAGNFVGHNGSAFVGHNGSAIVVAGSGFVGHNGSAVVAKAGGNAGDSGGGNAVDAGDNIVAQGAGNIVAQGAGNIVAQGGLNVEGAQLVSEGGGAIVGQGAGNIVAQGAGNFVGHNGSAYHTLALGGPTFGLLDAACSAPSSPEASGGTNTPLPIAALRVSVLSLTTNTPVPVGVDAKGKPVYTVYTDANGHFELYLPAQEQGNVQIVANVRLADGSNPLAEADSRLRYDLVRPATDATSCTAGNEATSLDDDTRTVTAFILQGFISRLRPFIRYAVADETPVTDFSTLPELAGTPYSRAEFDHVQADLCGFKIPAAALSVLTARLAAFHYAAHQAHLDTAPQADVDDHVRRMIQIVMADFPVTEVMLNESSSHYYHADQDEPAFAAMLQIMRQAREQAGTTDLAALTGKPFFKDAVAGHHVAPDFTFKTPGDVGAFIGTAYLSQGQETWGEIAKVLVAVGANTLPTGVTANHADGYSQRLATQDERLEACAQAFLFRVLLEQTDADKAAQLVAYLRAHPYTGTAATDSVGSPSGLPSPASAPTPCP